MVERLDEERLELLREWGVGLSTSGRDELRSAGRAISMLVEEVNRLQIEVWNARADAQGAARRAREADRPQRAKPVEVNATRAPWPLGAAV